MNDNSKHHVLHVIKWMSHTGAIHDTMNGFDVIECVPCDFKHIVPIPVKDELDEVYRQEYYSVEKPLYLEQHKENLDWWNLVYGERYDEFERLLLTDQRYILDIGSGPGYFLLHGKQRGWKTLGIEPSAQAVHYSRELGLDIIEGFLNRQNHLDTLDTSTFDVIHMSEVLEHIANPREMLGIARDMLVMDGLICVVVPNDYNPFQHVLRTVYGYEPWWVSPPYHINYFDVASLERLIYSSGFDVVSCETTFPIDMFLLMGDNYVGNDELGKQCHAKRKLFEYNLAMAGMGDLKQKLYQAFASIGVGREVQVIGRKCVSHVSHVSRASWT